MAQAKPVETEPDEIEAAVDEAIGLCGGDLRRTVRGLILGQRTYEADLERTVSADYVRRRRRPPRSADPASSRCPTSATG